MNGQTPYVPAKPLRTGGIPPTPDAAIGASTEPTLTLVSLTTILVKGAVTGLPKYVGTIGLRMGIAFAVNSVLGAIATWKLSSFLASIVMLLVFFTASYNSILPKALFWVLVMTVGVKLFHRVKTDGVRKVGQEIAQFVPNVIGAWRDLGKLSLPILGLGGGIGFAVANFLSRNNRIDKMLVCYVTALSVVDSLSRGSKSTLFLFCQAAVNDFSRLSKKAPFNSVRHVYIAGAGLALGLVLNTLFSLLTVDFGGYIVGAVISIGSVGYMFSHQARRA